MRQRILVVDDDPSLAEMLTIVLRGEGFDTAVIGDGTQALTAVRELRPDLVLLDLMLPGMNGIDVCRVLRADSGVPIVMLTAKTDTVDVVLGLESGADGDVVEWVRTLEYERLHLPAPDWQVLLDVPTELAAERAEHRANQETDRAKDAYERDDGLQRRTGEVYSGLAAAQWCGRWLVAGTDLNAAALAADLGP